MSVISNLRMSKNQLVIRTVGNIFNYVNLDTYAAYNQCKDVSSTEGNSYIGKMAEFDAEVDSRTIHRLVQAVGKQSKENFNESELLYTIEILEAGLQDVVKEVQGLKSDFKGIEEDTGKIKQQLDECASMLVSDTPV